MFGDVFAPDPRHAAQGTESRDRLAELMRDARRHGPDRSDDEGIPADEAGETEPARTGRSSTAGAGPRVRQWQGGKADLLSRLRETVGRHRVAVGLAVLAVLGGLGALLYGAGSSPRAEAPPPLPLAVTTSAPASSAPPSSAPVVVSVVGKVEHPGLVTLRQGARVADALQAAGGARHDTNLLGLNLASKVTDGQQILVGVTPPPGAPSAGPGPSGTAPGGNAGAAGGKVDLNTADEQQLETLSNVGPVTAKHIMDWREAHGGFKSTRQLEDVTGIGPKTYDELKDSVTVG